jgi:hypothetical protein
VGMTDYDKEKKERDFLDKIRKLSSNPIAPTGADFRRYVKKFLVHMVSEELYKKIIEIIN